MKALFSKIKESLIVIVKEYHTHIEPPKEVGNDQECSGLDYVWLASSLVLCPLPSN